MTMFMMPIVFILLLLGQASWVESAQPDTGPVIYLLPGQGADCRIFNKIVFPYDTVHLEFPMPDKNSSLHEYAMRFVPRIDTCHDFILIGVSLGGMICSELADTLDPDKIIVISSAKCRNELPGKYKFQKYIPLNQVIPQKTIYRGANFLAPRIEPERKTDSLFESMLGKKDPLYLKRSINMITDWEKEGYDSSIVHIHGDGDGTIPIKHIAYDYLVPGGTHMMVYFRGPEINELIKQILMSPVIKNQPDPVLK